MARGLLVRFRIAAAFAWGLAAALAIDAWIRFWILPRTRHDAAAKSAAINRIVKVWADVMFGAARWSAGLEVAVEGRIPETGRYLVVANHQSSLDVPLLIATLRGQNLKFVSMERLRRGRPAISLMIRHGGFVCVGKQDVGKDLDALRLFAKQVSRFDGSPVIFPAGGLERDHGQRPFLVAGIEAVRRASRLPILPVVIEGLSSAPTIGGLVRLAGAKVTMRVFEPVSFEAASRDPRGTYARLESDIYQDLATLRGDGTKLT